MISFIRAAVENIDSTHFFKLPKLTAPLLFQIEGSLEDVSSWTLDVRRRAVGDGSIAYWRVWRYDLAWSQRLVLAEIKLTEGACKMHKAEIR